MGHGKKDKKKGKNSVKDKNKANETAATDAPAETKLKTKEYEKELAELHVEMVKLQQWVVHKGLKVCVVFEGRDHSGFHANDRCEIAHDTNPSHRSDPPASGIPPTVNPFH